jgi:hypothetical protein
MLKLKTLKLASSKIGQFKEPINANVANLRLFPDNVPFMCMQDSINVAVIEVYADDKMSKKTYLLADDIASQLAKSDYKIKQLFVVYTADGLVRSVILDADSINSWNRSSLECLAVAKEKPISANRDYEAKVYGYIVEESIAPFGVTDEQIDAALSETFDGEYHITSLDHPMVWDLVKKDRGSVIAVDEQKSSVYTVAKAIEIPNSDRVESKTTSVVEDDWMRSLEIPEESIDMDADLSLDDIKL